MDGMSPDCTRVPNNDDRVTENVKASVLDELSEASAPIVYTAAFYGSTEALDVLLNAGADVNKVGGPHFTVLQVASPGGHTDIVKNILRKGANPQIHGGEWGSALKAALVDQKFITAETLTAAGVDVHHISEYCYSPLIPCSNIMIMSLGGSAFAAISMACGKGTFRMVQFLLKLGADPKYKSAQHTRGGNPLIGAIYVGNDQLLKTMLDYGLSSSGRSQDGGYPILTAAYYNRETVTQILLNHHADPNVKLLDHHGGEVPLQVADSRRVLEMLLEHGALIDMQTAGYGTALHKAISDPLRKSSKRKHHLNGEDKVLFLISRGADVTSPTGTVGLLLE